MAAAVASIESRTTPAPAPTLSHVVFRLVQPGSWQRCLHCLEPIEFVPGGRRAQATARVYYEGVLQDVEHFHAECFLDVDDI